MKSLLSHERETEVGKNVSSHCILRISIGDIEVRANYRGEGEWENEPPWRYETLTCQWVRGECIVLYNTSDDPFDIARRILLDGWPAVEKELEG